jgi:hypothetical protein
MAIADNTFTGLGNDGKLQNNDNWSAALAADQNLIFPADAPTTYTLKGDLSLLAFNSLVNRSACNFGGSSDSTATSTHTFVEADISVGDNTITEANHGLTTGQTIVFTTTGTLPAELTAGTTYYVIVASSSTYKVAASLADAIAGTAIDLTDDGDAGTHTATFQTYVPVRVNVGSADGSKTNLLDDAGTGTRYINVTNAVNANIAGRGTVELDGINNATLRINTTGTVTVGPSAAIPAEFDTVALVAGSGTVVLENITTQAAAAVPITMISGTVKLYTYSRLANVYQSGGTWRHYDNGVATHQSGVVAAIYQKAGTCFYNSIGALTALEAYGKMDFSTEDMRAKTVTTGKFYKGSTLSDPNGVVTWTNPFQVPYGSLRDVSADVGAHKKYTVAAI